MARSSGQKLKILYILDIFKKYTDDTHGITVRKIIEELEALGINAERKSVYEDIAALCEIYGADIVMTKSGAGAEYALLSRDFELPELKLLVDAVSSSKFITRKKSDALIHKLENLTSKFGASELQSQVFVSNRIKTMNETIFYNVDAVNSAITSNRAITFTYFEWTPKKDKKLRRDGKRYDVSPWFLSWDSENYYMIAFDNTEQKIKHYRVDKMLDIKITDMPRLGEESFEKFDVAVYSGKVFGMYGGKEETVTLRFNNELAGAVIDRFGSDIMMVPDTDTFTVTVKVQISPQFFAWLCGFKNNAKIISPKAVTEEFKKYIEDISKLYK